MPSLFLIFYTLVQVKVNKCDLCLRHYPEDPILMLKKVQA